MKPPLGEEAVSGMDLKREGANISLAIKFLKWGGRGSPLCFDLILVNYQLLYSLDQVVLSSNTRDQVYNLSIISKENSRVVLMWEKECASLSLFRLLSSLHRNKKIPELFYQAIREICKIGSGCSSQRGSSKPWKRKASLDPTIYILLYVIEYEGVAITVFH